MSILTSDTICPKCGKSKVGEYKHLRLGADEAPILVKCVCDTQKSNVQSLDQIISLSTKMVKTSFVLRKNRVQISDKVVYGPLIYEYELTTEHEIAKEIFMMMDVPIVKWSETGCPCSMNIHGRIVSARARFRSTGEDTAKYMESSMIVCPGMRFTNSYEVSVKRSGFEDDIENQGYNIVVQSKFSEYKSWSIRCSRYMPDMRYSCEFEWKLEDEPDENDILDLIGHIHTEYGHTSSMRRHLGDPILSSLRMSSLPVIDIREVPDEGHIFRIKVDGENCWSIDVGCMWYICRPDVDVSVMGWLPKTSLKTFVLPPVVVRCEQLVDGSLVYVDLLCDGKRFIEITRQYLSPTKELRMIKDKPRMIIRKDHDNYDSALEESIISELPNDGVIAIDVDTHLTYRIKIPTLDLMCHKGYLVCGKKGAYASVVKALPSMKDGKIYECSLLGDSIETLMVESYTIRSDKMRPNAYSVAQDIVGLVIGDLNYDSVITRRVTSFCFAVRKYLYSTASDLVTKSKLIIDVGTNRFQSMSLFPNDKSMLFCDPDLDLPPIFEGIVNIAELPRDEMTAVIEALSKGKIRRACYKGHFEDLIAIPSVYRHITFNRVPIVYSFSLSYLVSTYNQLAMSGACQIGCCYMYDNVDVNGVLIDKGGIVMRMKSDDTATVTFPPSESFDEPVVNTADFVYSDIQPGLDVMPWSFVCSADIRDVIKHVYVVKTDSYE